MFYNSRAPDPAYSAAAHRRRRSINPERPPRTRRKIKNGKPSNNQAGELYPNPCFETARGATAPADAPYRRGARFIVQK